MSRRFGAWLVGLGLATATASCGSGTDSSGPAKPAEEDPGGPPPFNGVDTSQVCPAGQVGWDFSTGGGRVGVDGGAPATGKKCIPKVCTGKQQRAADMTCVATATMPSVELTAASKTAGQPFLMSPSSEDYAQEWVLKSNADGTRSDYTGTVVSIGEGSWGDWTTMQFCPTGMWGNGFRQRVESDQGKGDDTALNAVELACANQFGMAAVVQPHTGIWGDWSATQYCPSGKYVRTAEIRTESNQGSGDDTAGNDVHFICSDNTTVLNAGNGRGWGTWGGQKSCPTDQVICGIQVRVESNQGGNSDDTAMNGLKVACCKAPGSVASDASNSVRPIYQQVPYTYKVGVPAAGDAFKAKVAVWVTRRFSDKRAKTVPKPTGLLPDIEGFVCTMTDLEMTKAAAGISDVLAQSTDTGEIISGECVTGYDKAWSNAVARLAAIGGGSSDQYDSTVGDLVFHMSFDPQGDVTIPAGKGLSLRTTSAVANQQPNPQGFFYNPATKWVDMIGFYQQREVALYSARSATAPRTDATFLHEVTQSAFALPTKLLLAVKGLTVQTPVLVINPLDPVLPHISVDVDWQRYGDVLPNPYSEQTGAPTVSGVTRMNARNLRASVEIRPTGAAGEAWLAFGTDTLAASTSAAAGTNKNVSVFNAAVTTQLADVTKGVWYTATSFDVRACILGTGLEGRSEQVQSLRLPAVQSGTYQFSAGLETTGKSCFTKVAGLTVTREFVQRPSPPQRDTADLGMGDTSASGNSSSTGAAGTGSQEGCTASPTGQTCTSVNAQSLAGSGTFTRMLYESNTTGTKNATTSSNSANVKGNVAVMGYQVIDMSDPGQSMNFNGPAPPSISINLLPDWSALKEVVDKQPKAGPVKPTVMITKTKKGVVKADTEGIAIGIETEGHIFIGPIPGTITASASVGVGFGLSFNIDFAPDAPYPCINSNGSKCFSADSTARSQTDAAKRCAGLGGRLAEVRNQGDRDGIAAAAAGDSNYWVGAQLAYVYDRASCATITTANSAVCIGNSKTSYRWIGSDREFASSPNTSTTVTTNFINFPVRPPGGLRLETAVPTPAGLAYQGQLKRMSTMPTSITLPSVCEFDGAARTTYADFHLDLALVASAGIGLSFYIPDSNFGFGIEGNLNFIEVGLTPTIGRNSFELFDATGKWIGSRSDAYTSGPWDVNLMHATVEAVANLLFYSVHWPIIEFPGFNVAGGKLWDLHWPARQGVELPTAAFQADPAPVAGAPIVLEAEWPSAVHLVGRLDTGGGWSASTSDAAGYMYKGTYTGPATSTGKTAIATYRMKSDAIGTSDVVATLEVFDLTTNAALASRMVRRSEFATANLWTDLGIEYTVPAGGHQIEVRVYYNDNATVSVDRATVTDRRSDYVGISLISAGTWGDWQGMRYCPDRMYAVSYRLRSETNQGGNSDDTALNGVELHCQTVDGSKSQNVVIFPGLWGNWGAFASCDADSFITGGKMQVESNQGSGDDTAGNNYSARCSNGKDLAAPVNTNWGGWGAVVQCPTGQVVCGAEARFEKDQGSGDDTALNGLQVACCTLIR